MADINDRLDRLNKREELARRALHRPEPPVPPRRPMPPPEPVAAADGSHDGFAEVLDAVARVVVRHPGLSVMLGVPDGRPGRSVIRVTERGGTVETVVVAGAGAGSVAGPARLRPAGVDPAAVQPAAVQPAGVDPAGVDPAGVDPAGVDPAAADSAAVRPAAVDPAAVQPTAVDPAGVDTAAADPAAGSGARPTQRPWVPEARRGGLRLVPDPEPEPGPPAAPGVAGGMAPLSADTSQVVARLAQLLREDPSLASSWGREAQES